MIGIFIRCCDEVLAVFISTGNRSLETTSPKLLFCTKRLIQDCYSIHHPCWFLAPIKLQSNEMQVELCPSLQEVAYIEGLNQFVVKTQQRAWYIWYANGRLEGMGWESFAAAHALKEDDTVVVSVANDLSLVAMVFDQDGCERTFYWYTDI
ncbi:hypothetical protein RHMOL_Rhmol11G0107500 [Rhododendron molle]|uniref:Uncharacterized protein n=1 Tax=Rhododendron molle TaxID=49168 RepID=A0ACC0LR72_RHOML|nr:hypothetical protein RHMOL_Rhmol11G0107500 [Rhododendron molle]